MCVVLIKARTHPHTTLTPLLYLNVSLIIFIYYRAHQHNTTHTLESARVCLCIKARDRQPPLCERFHHFSVLRRALNHALFNLMFSSSQQNQYAADGWCASVRTIKLWIDNSGIFLVQQLK